MVYSPELVTAQEELLQANGIKESQPELFNAAKEKLRNWKIGENTINKIITTGKPIQRFPISADVSGIVTAKKVELGDYVDRGMSLYEITDLSAVWVMFDIYESDMPWVKVGQKVTYTIQSLPGKTFEGKISFIDPFINPQTRVSLHRVGNRSRGDTPHTHRSWRASDSLGETSARTPAKSPQRCWRNCANMSSWATRSAAPVG